MKTTKLFLGMTMMLSMAFAGCSGSGEPLEALADVYAEMADNDSSVGEAFQAVYKAGRNEQQALHEKAVSLAEEMKAKNEKLAEKASELGAKLHGTAIECRASEAMGTEISKAVFTTVNAQDRICNIVVTISCAEPSSQPYCLMMDKDGNLLWKTPGTYNNSAIKVNFRITRNKEQAEVYGKLNHIMIVTQAEYAAGVAGTSGAPAADADAPEATYQGDDATGNIQSAQTAAGEIKVGANLRAALESATKVTYEYNADSGIWANVGSVAIVINEDQLTQQGIDFIAAILSDIVPDIAFKPEYVKPDATIQQIEAQ